VRSVLVIEWLKNVVEGGLVAKILPQEGLVPTPSKKEGDERTHIGAARSQETLRRYRVTISQIPEQPKYVQQERKNKQRGEREREIL